MDKPRYIQIDIPDPCQEDWNKMTPCEKGRHCGSCQRTVIDFTTWSDAALYEFFSKDRGHICGRYLATQVGRPIHIPPQPHSRLYRMVVAAGLTLIFAQSGYTYAQSRPPVATQQAQGRLQKDSGTHADPGQIMGTVMDDKKQPVIGAIVQVYMDGVTKGGAVTDFDGMYVIKPLEAGKYKVVVQYSGMETKNIDSVVVPIGDTVVVNAVLTYSHSDLQTIFVGWKKPLFSKPVSKGVELESEDVKAVQVEWSSPETPERQNMKDKAIPTKTNDTPPGYNVPGKRIFKKDEIKNMPIR